MNIVKEYFETDLSEEVAIPIATLATQAFGASGLNVERRVAEMLAAADSLLPHHVSGRRFVVWNEKKAIAHARTFIRIVNSDDGEIPVLALASVCSDPEFRGRGWGAKITRKAFELIGMEGWPDVSLFQTPVPSFYEKLNCRVVQNRFVNRRSTEPEVNPWRDDTIMIYPAKFNWPAGIIDLNGSDY